MIWCFFKVVITVYAHLFSCEDSLTTLKCPDCTHKFEVGCNENGTCPNCKKRSYDWDYLIDNGNDEIEVTGYCWIEIDS